MRRDHELRALTRDALVVLSESVSDQMTRLEREIDFLSELIGDQKIRLSDTVTFLASAGGVLAGGVGLAATPIAPLILPVIAVALLTGGALSLIGQADDIATRRQKTAEYSLRREAKLGELSQLENYGRRILAVLKTKSR